MFVDVCFHSFSATFLRCLGTKTWWSRGQEKCAEAKVAILGGHTVEDLEPKYGLAVIGTSREPSGLRVHKIVWRYRDGHVGSVGIVEGLGMWSQWAWCCLMVYGWYELLVVDWCWFQYASVWSHCFCSYASVWRLHLSYLWIMNSHEQSDWEINGKGPQVSLVHLLLWSGVVHPKKVWLPGHWRYCHLSWPQ